MRQVCSARACLGTTRSLRFAGQPKGLSLGSLGRHDFSRAAEGFEKNRSFAPPHLLLTGHGQAPSLSAVRFPPFAKSAKDGAPSLWLRQRINPVPSVFSPLPPRGLKSWRHENPLRPIHLHNVLYHFLRAERRPPTHHRDRSRRVLHDEC